MKSSVSDLAVFGAAPAFTQKLHVGRPNIGDRGRLLDRINDILDRHWLTNNGVYVQEFERRIAETVGVEHCIATCNGTVALEIAVRALGLHGEVIVPSFTFIATAHALQWQEITPVFCDIDPISHSIDPHQVERMITPRTSGIVGVHIWGRACDTEALEDIARRRGLRLLFDAAHAFACSSKGVMIGGFGDAEVFSFHATKFFNTFEGGAVVTNDGGLAKRIRLMKNFGFAGVDNVVHIGTNGKMSEVSAAMGLTNLEQLGEFIAVNQRNYEQYRRELCEAPGLKLMDFDEGEKYNYQHIVVEIDQRSELSRDDLVKVLWTENVMARRYFYPGCHRMEPYRSYYPHAGLLLPVTERVSEHVLLLPTGTGVGADEIRTVCSIIRTAMRHGAKVHHALASGTPPDARV